MLRPLVRHMWRLAFVVHEHRHTHVAQLLDAAVEGWVRCLGGVQEWQCHERQAQTDRFGQ